MKRKSIISVLVGIIILATTFGIIYGYSHDAKAGGLVPHGIFVITLNGLSNTTPATYGTITVTTGDGTSVSKDFVYGQSTYVFGGFNPSYSGIVCSSANLYNTLCPAIGGCVSVNGIGWNPPSIGPSVSFKCTEE